MSSYGSEDTSKGIPYLSKGDDDHDMIMRMMINDDCHCDEVAIDATSQVPT